MFLRNSGCRITDAYIFNGYRIIVMENELLRISILADKGTDIFEFLYKPLDLDFMWRSPTGFQNPAKFVPSVNSPEGNFTDFYHGGWQEIFPMGSTACKYKEADFGLHGEVSLIPWEYQIIKDTPEEISVKFRVRTYRTPFLLEKTLTLKQNQAILHIAESVTNEGEEVMDFMWGHHPAIGEPFLDEHCIIDAPAGKVESSRGVHLNNRIRPDEYTDWPMVHAIEGTGLIDISKIPPKSSKSLDMLFLTELTEGWYGITNTRKKVGFGMCWDKELFKHIWYWMVFGGADGYPWYGRTYNLALEPWTSYCNYGDFNEIIKEGNQVKIKPKEQIHTELKAIVYTGIERVKQILPDGTVIGKNKVRDSIQRKSLMFGIIIQ